MIPIFFISLIVVGCTSDGELSGSQTSINASNRSSCFNTTSINDYEVLDRGNLIVYGRPRKRAYHLQISPPNLDLGGSDMISFRSWTGRICGYAGDELSYQMIYSSLGIQSRMSQSSMRQDFIT